MSRITKRLLRVLTFAILSGNPSRASPINQMKGNEINRHNNNNNNANLFERENKNFDFNKIEKVNEKDGDGENENQSQVNYNNKVIQIMKEKNVEKGFNDYKNNNIYNNNNKKNIHEEEKLEYPIISIKNNFIPNRRYVHIDLKGGVYKFQFYNQLFSFYKKIGANGILLEWEDVFPYNDGLEEAVSGEAYTMDNVKEIVRMAKEDFKFDVIPLVQTFGHLEWILKLKKYTHLRESSKYPQALCIGKEEAFDLVKKMIDQVGEIHKKYGMKYFHIGADEVYQIGMCPETKKVMDKNSYDREKVMLWHIKRVAEYVKSKYDVSVLVWHDMLIQVPENYLTQFGLTNLIEPVLWSYAEDLDYYLPYQTWLALKPFKNVWGASAFKGADGPQRYTTHAEHYIKNHDSWIKQMTNVYKQFDSFQGLFFCGWSRYDHMALLAELMPVSLPTLAYSMETIIKGEPLDNKYPKSTELLGCYAPTTLTDFVYGCTFPGHAIYEGINELGKFEKKITDYLTLDHEYGGWMSDYNVKYKISQPMREEKTVEVLRQELYYIEDLSKRLRSEIEKIYSNETADEILYSHVRPLYEKLKSAVNFAEEMLNVESFPKRPFVDYKEL